MDTEKILDNIRLSIPNISSEKVNGGWLVYALDNSGRAIALTFIPDRP